MMNQSPQGLASLGRNGDTMLMHVNPSEVAGLQSLAMSQGGSLTINPDTGLPEAFSLGNFFKSLLPMIAGAAMPASAGLFAGIAAGAATGALTNKDKLMGAITGGLGGYGGFNIGQGLRAAALPGATASTALEGTAANIGGQGAGDVIGTNVLQQQPAGFGGLGFGITTPAEAQALNSSNLLNQSGFFTSGSSGSGNIINPALNNISQMGTGAGNVVSGEPGALAAYTKGIGAKTGMGALVQTALPIGGAALGGLEPSDIYGEPINMSEAKKKQAYDPNARLDLSADTGLRLYADGGSIQSSGIRDLYGGPDNQPTMSTGLGGFGLGRLNDLANEQARTQAQTYGYAMGGPVSFADGGESNKDIMGLPSLSSDMSMDPNAGADNPAMVQSIMGAMQGNAPMTQSQSPEQTNDSLIAKVTSNLRADPNYQPTNSIEASIVNQIKGNDSMQQGQPSLQGLGSIAPSQPMAPSFNPSQAMGPTYYAGINAPRGMARGGYLDGQGDGMSDSIPATIEGKQPARLADGEFVVPADVVSHLGNGSSKAGSKRLYAMLDKIRHARTGNKKQGKQINPSKYMPA